MRRGFKPPAQACGRFVERAILVAEENGRKLSDEQVLSMVGDVVRGGPPFQRPRPQRLTRRFLPSAEQR